MVKLPEDPEQLRMSFGEHLEELRRRLFKGLGLIFVLFIGGWAFLDEALQKVFLAPHFRAIQALNSGSDPLGLSEKLQVHSPLEVVFFNLKISLILALIIGFPYLVYQVWGFVAAGLYPKERKVVMRYVPFSMFAAVAGILFGYFIIIPLILQFLYGMINPAFMDDAYRLSYYFSIFLMFTLALTAVFQLPLIMMGLGAAGLVEAKTLRRYRRHFVLGCFVFAAIFTPPEPFSQVLMAVPTITLYEFGILLVAFRAKKNAQTQTETSS